MNYLDWIVIGIIIFFMLAAYKKGFAMSLYGFVSTALSMVLAYNIYPIVARILRNVPTVYGFFYNAASDALRLDEAAYKHSMSTQTELINSLPLPTSITDKLLENNNPVLYDLLNVSAIEDYVLSYIANICINVLSLLLVFCAVGIIMAVLAGSLNIITKLPILNGVNRLAGLAVGLFQGVLVVWILGLVVVFLISHGNAEGLAAALDTDGIAAWFYKNNRLWHMISNISI